MKQDDHSHFAIDWDSIANQLKDPLTSEQTARLLLRFVLSVVSTMPNTRIALQLPARIDLSDIVQTALKSIIKAIEAYRDDEGDAIRAKLIRLIRNKTVDKIKYSFCASRDVRREEQCDTITSLSNDKRLLQRSKPKRERYGVFDSAESMPKLTGDLVGLSIENAIELIQNGFNSDEAQRLSEECELLPSNLRLVFWLTLAGMKGDEIKEALRSMGESHVTRGRVIHRQRLIRELLGSSSNPSIPSKNFPKST